jgi:hypothetical protein
VEFQGSPIKKGNDRHTEFLWTAISATFSTGAACTTEFWFEDQFGGIQK